MGNTLEQHKVHVARCERWLLRQPQDDIHRKPMTEVSAAFAADLPGLTSGKLNAVRLTLTLTPG